MMEMIQDQTSRRNFNLQHKANTKNAQPSSTEYSGVHSIVVYILLILSLFNIESSTNLIYYLSYLIRGTLQRLI